MTDSANGGHAGPRAAYAALLESRRASETDAIRQHRTFGNLRVTLALAGAAAAYVSLGPGLFSAWWLLVLAAAFVWTSARLATAERARTRFGRAVSFYRSALGRLDGRWAGAGGATGERFADEAHLYARDLDLFGPASVFELLSSARTRIGEETLAAWLGAPADAEVILARQHAVVELAQGITLREDLAVLGEDASTGVDASALVAWSERPPMFRQSATPLWIWLLSGAGLVALGGVLVRLAVYAGLLQLGEATLTLLHTYILICFALSGAVFWRFRRLTGAILGEMAGAADDLGLLAGVLGRLEAERFTAAHLATLGTDLDDGRQSASRRIVRLERLLALADSRRDIFVRRAGVLVLWDLHLAYAIERWRRVSGPAVRRWLVAVGEMEALVSLAAYRYEHPEDVFPEIAAGPSCFDAEGLGHPLLPEDVMVPNDVRLTGPLRVLVVSGSNMAGKSTLLRAVGVNAVLAQAGAPVRARRLRVSVPLHVGASIRIQDSLQSGVSRFHAEIVRLNQIMRRASEVPVLFLVDELLHGTNSHDRAIGAEAVVRGLIDAGALGLATTHDLALATVALALGARGANVHFQDTLEDGRMRFDYLMRPGTVQKSNALALMRAIGMKV